VAPVFNPPACTIILGIGVITALIGIGLAVAISRRIARPIII
jgi:hypothetical protein